MEKWEPKKVYRPLRSQSRGRSRRNGKIKRKLAWILNLKKNLKRSFQKLKRRFSFKYVTFPLIGLALIGLIYTILFSSLFAVQKIEVNIIPGENNLEEETLKQEIKKRISDSNLLFLSAKKLSFLNDDLTIAKIKIKKNWTHGLVVEIEKRAPRVVVSDARGRLFLADEEGVIFARGNVEALPTIGVSENLSLGANIAKELVRFSTSLLEKLSSQGFSYETLEASESVRLKISEGPEIISPPQAEKIDELLAILKNYRSRGISLLKIDLRHTHPVIQY